MPPTRPAASATASTAAAPPASAPSPEALLDLVADQIDKLQLVASAKGPQPPTALTEAEQAALTTAFTDLTSSLPPPSSPAERESALLDRVKRLLEAQLRSDSATKEWKERAERQGKQKERLEKLCKDFTVKNKQLTVSTQQPTQEDMRSLSSAHDKSNSELRGRFDSTLASIQVSIASHSAERERIFADNATMREQLNKLLEYDAAKDAAHAHALQTKELEHRLLSTQLAQAQATVQMRESQVALLQAEAEQAREKEKILQAEVGSYTQRMQGVQEVMDKTAQVMDGMKGEVSKLTKKLKKEGEERLKAEEKVKESTAMLLAGLEDRKAEQLEALKVKRQLSALQQLCQALEREKREWKDKDRGKAVADTGGAVSKALVQAEVKGDDIKAQLTTAEADASTATVP